MYKKIIYRLLILFLFVFIFVTFLIPSDLVAEIRQFLVIDGHYEDQDFWVTSGELQDTWVDTSHNAWVTSGYFQDTQEKRWVDTSHMVYQGYWKDFTHNVWVDTTQWVSSGYWEDVTERVWVDTSHNEWVESGYWKSEWVDTSHNVWVEDGHWVWVSSGYTANRWVDTSHNAWISSGYTANRWVDTSHNAWVSSGYTANRWVVTSHWVWVSSGYLNSKRVWVNTSHNVWVESGYWQSYWVDTSHNVWVESGYWQSYWVDTSHNVWVEEGHWESYWVDTSHNVWVDTSHNAWVSSGYSQNTWVVTSNWVWITSGYYEDQKVWVEGHYETRYREVEDWQPCDVTFVWHLNDEPWWAWTVRDVLWSIPLGEGTFDNKVYKYVKYCDGWRSLLWDGSNELIIIFDIKYKCYEVLNGTKKEAYSEWVEGYWKREWVDTSHWVKSGYWQSDTYSSWVDTSYMIESGHWEDYTERTWVDTSHNVWVTDGHTERVWVDTSHNETRDVWVDTSHWVEAELDPEGKVLHTDKWNENRINYNLSASGDPEKPRGYKIFFNGERFVLEADTPGYFQPESVHVEFLGTGFETYLTNTGDIKWEGYIWDESFIFFHDRDCVFKFTASYDYNGDQFEIEDDVTVYIVRDFYWTLHRGF